MSDYIMGADGYAYFTSTEDSGEVVCLFSNGKFHTMSKKQAAIEEIKSQPFFLAQEVSE